MSRSNPQEHLSNPAVRWFEWNGEKGLVRYYDKDAKQNVDIPLPFTFILLDELASVRGWHDPSQSGIYSNEVRDTTQELLLVKSFKGGIIAEGKYKDIKLVVNNAGGAYVASCYIACKGTDGQYYIGSIRMKGAALGAWMEFRKANRADIYKKAIKISGFTEGKKGKVVYRMPEFALNSVSADAEAMAVKLDRELQEFLCGYLKKNKRDQADAVAHHVSDEDVAGAWQDNPEAVAAITEDDIPF